MPEVRVMDYEGEKWVLYREMLILLKEAKYFASPDLRKKHEKAVDDAWERKEP